MERLVIDQIIIVESRSVSWDDLGACINGWCTKKQEMRTNFITKQHTSNGGARKEPNWKVNLRKRKDFQDAISFKKLRTRGWRRWNWGLRVEPELWYVLQARNCTDFPPCCACGTFWCSRSLCYQVHLRCYSWCHYCHCSHSFLPPFTQVSDRANQIQLNRPSL